MSSTGRLPWARITADGVVIVASILLAFALDAWWDRRNEQQEERVILTDLRSDFEASLEGLEERWIPLHDAAQNATLELLWVMARGDEPLPPRDERPFIEGIVVPIVEDGGPGGTGPVMVRDSILGAALGTATYDPTLATLEALLAGGALGKISNRELRTRLAELPSMLADLRDEEELARDHVYTVLRPLLHRQVNAVAAEMIGYAWVEGGAPLPAAVADRRTELQVSRELANTLSARHHTQVGVVGEAANVRAAMVRVIALLDEELDGPRSDGR